VKVHVDCVNANSLVTEDKSTDKDGFQSVAAKPQDPTQQGTALSNGSSSTQNIEVIDRETNNEKDIYRSGSYPPYTVSDMIGKSWYSIAKLSADIFSWSSRLSSLYYEQCLQYEKVWSYYWTETYKSFSAFSQRNESPKTNAI
jgi:hypothetical protein